MAPIFRSVHDLPPQARIHVYGTGRGGRALAAYLARAGRPPESFLDSFNDGLLDGRPVLAFPMRASSLFAGDVILMASSFRRDIEHILAAWPVFDRRDAFAFAAALAGEQDRLLDFAQNGRIVLSP